jgi:DNA-3-methyladenine glycosylase
MNNKIQKEFYLRPDVTEIARDLLGQILVTRINGEHTSGIIIETEAYSPDDRASHAFQHKKTRRNASMFMEGGISYVFMNYGIHFLFNVVTNVREEPDAVLIRGLEPLDGKDIMMQRRGKNDLSRITSGPGSLSKAMAIDLNLNGISLMSDRLWIETGNSVPGKDIVCTRRIGVEYAGEHAKLARRYYLKNNPWVSKP